MAERLTVSGTTNQRDIDKLLELSNENQFGRNKAYYKLQHYEDLEEQSRLIELPCKVGDTVWSFVYETIICGEVIAIKYEIEVENYGTSIVEKITIDFSDIDGEFEATVDFQDFGKKVFLTKEETEATLKELKEGAE